MSTEEEIMDEAQEQSEQITREAAFKIQEMNDQVYRDCAETARSMQEARARAETERLDLEQTANQERQDIVQGSNQIISKIEIEKKIFLDEQKLETLFVDVELSNFQEQQSQETQRANDILDDKVAEIRESKRLEREQLEIELKEQAKAADVEADRIFAEKLQKSENDKFALEREGHDEITNALFKLEKVKQEQLRLQEELRRKAASDEESQGRCWVRLPRALNYFLKKSKSTDQPETTQAQGKKLSDKKYASVSFDDLGGTDDLD